MNSNLEAPSDEHRFDELFRNYAPAVFRYALRAFHGNTDRANEVVQQVFIAVWKQYDRDFRDQPEQRTVALIMRIAGRRVIDLWRQRSKSEVLVGDYLDTDIPLMRGATLRRDPLQRVLEEDDLERFVRVLDSILTETEYRVAMMAWELGLPDIEIAGVLDCTVSTVHSHKSRARKKIEAMMNRTEAKVTFDSAEDLVEVIAEHRQTAGEATGTRAKGVRPA
ncbi:RNA polymerase sigma factor [Nocardia brasiliensis]|uniref:RNA polymerase sigma factor n=1 Tax=Nocardia brasiliensis TaxID=37326 RepID=UPI00245882E9|nr:sigma-70 family RNA polymerase sigma factor [Nocardia brasiliensis]